MTYLAINFILTLVLLGSYVLLALRQDGWRKYVGPAAFGTVCLLSLALLTCSLGQPRPSWSLIYWEQYKIVDIQYDINKAIYLWGYYEGSHVPVAVVIPWDLTTAKKMAEAQQKTRSGGGTMMLNSDSPTDPITIVAPDPPQKEVE